MAPSPVKRAFFRALLVVLASGATLLLAEAGARLLTGPRIQLIAPDPVLGWRLKRNAEFRGSVTTNSSGFRDREHAPGESPVLVLGDSYVAGLAMRQREILHVLLEKKLGLPVAAAAAPAWSTGQQLLYFAEEGWRLHPRAVVLLMAPNDIRETFANGFHRLDSGGRLVRNPPRQVPWKDRLLWYGLNRSTLVNHLAAWWHTNSAFEILLHTWRFTFSTEYGSAQDRDLFRVEPAREILEAERLFAAELLELQTEVNRRGSRLLLAVLPTKMEREDPVARAPNFRPGRVAERVRAVAKSHGIAWADLSPLRREEGIFLADDYHLSAHGHERVAERLSVAIRGAKKSGAYD